MFKFCKQNHKRVLNPIIDWSDAEIWEFIKEYNVPYCALYDKGHKRLGCIGCPMSTRQKEELERYPKFKALYLKAFEELIKVHDDESKRTSWHTADDVLRWWLKEDAEMPETIITEELFNEQ